MRNNPGVPLRKKLFAALLLLAAAVLPQLLWMGAHVATHHGHAEGAEQPALAKALVHGHEHEEGVPDHEHHLLPSPPLRRDTPHDLQVPVLASLKVSDAEHPLLSSLPPGWSRIRLSGAAGPGLHLLCVLLI